MKIEMTNPKTGEVKEIKVGWSWILFLFSSFCKKRMNLATNNGNTWSDKTVLFGH